jgi:hypothetical protein
MHSNAWRYTIHSPRETKGYSTLTAGYLTADWEGKKIKRRGERKAYDLD